MNNLAYHQVSLQAHPTTWQQNYHNRFTRIIVFQVVAGGFTETIFPPWKDLHT